ncbi:hypothetical protein GDO78_011932 [Eleutherodactylus coqui]|uniref:Adenosine deaminase domain-containing protein 1 n=1 Tax=Eleutherodactylus coqui TaxID=57060 RepID=A0A8J6K688_ELECQ|nr:hypothetical protein GDO78_011932 [Eleutherodactylus coqui]
MAGVNDWNQTSRVPGFAQILKRNLPFQPSAAVSQAAAWISHISSNGVCCEWKYIDSSRPKITSVCPSAFSNFPEPLLSKAILPPSPWSLAPIKVPKEFIMKYKRGGLNPVSALHQFVQMQRMQLELKETTTTGNVFGTYFAFCAVIDGIQYKTGMGQNKKEAKVNAAKLALDELLRYEESESYAQLAEGANGSFKGGPPLLPVEANVSTGTSRKPVDKRSFAYERMTQVIKEKYNELLSKCPEYESCGNSLAAFILETDLLYRFFYRHLLLYYSGNSGMMMKSIFCREAATDLLALKQNLNLCLYMNQLPKGAAQTNSHLRPNPFSLSAHENNDQLSLHISVENRNYPIAYFHCDTTANISSMSPTDKLTKWEILGVQGALLSIFMQPVYISSILVDALAQSVLLPGEWGRSCRRAGHRVVIVAPPRHVCRFQPIRRLESAMDCTEPMVHHGREPRCIPGKGPAAILGRRFL